MGLHICYLFVLILQYITTSIASPLSTPDPALILNAANSSILDNEIITNFLHTPNTTLLTTDFQQWHILDTPTSLRIALRPGTAIPKRALGITLLTTQQTLRAYISTQYRAAETALSPSDDPYKSSPRFTDCFIGVSTFPNGNKHLTYGVVANVLQGLWDFLYRGGREGEAVFEVVDEVWGTVGVGKVTRERPGGG
ncbi:hypothetical protein ACLMJK_005999 [Lecanora helva]